MNSIYKDQTWVIYRPGEDAVLKYGWVTRQQNGNLGSYLSSLHDIEENAIQCEVNLIWAYPENPSKQESNEMPRIIKTTYLHCGEGTSDKVYIITTSQNKTEYELKAQYGRRGSSLNDAPQGSFYTETSANTAHMHLVRAKKGKGYTEVDANFALNASVAKPTLVNAPPKLVVSKSNKPANFRKISLDDL